jgi:hypothetical protein
MMMQNRIHPWYAWILAALICGPCSALLAQTSQPATRPTTREAAGLDTPEAAVHELMVAMVLGDQERINRCTIPASGRELLAGGEGPPPEIREQVIEQLKTMPLRRLKVGETVNLPGGKTMVMTKDMVNADVQQLTSPEMPFPFTVGRVEKEWKVDPRPLIAARRAARGAATRSR